MYKFWEISLLLTIFTVFIPLLTARIFIEEDIPIMFSTSNINFLNCVLNRKLPTAPRLPKALQFLEPDNPPECTAVFIHSDFKLKQHKKVISPDRIGSIVDKYMIMTHQRSREDHITLISNSTRFLIAVYVTNPYNTISN